MIKISIIVNSQNIKVNRIEIFPYTDNIQSSDFLLYNFSDWSTDNNITKNFSHNFHIPFLIFVLRNSDYLLKFISPIKKRPGKK